MTTSSLTSQITYTKLRDGNWGLRGHGLTAGSRVTVTKRDGSSKTETVGRVLWSGNDGVQLATIAASASHDRYSGYRQSVAGQCGCSCHYGHGGTRRACRDCRLDGCEVVDAMGIGYDH